MNIHYLEDNLETGSAFSLTVLKVLYSNKSAFQKIDVIETSKFGKVLLIDGLIMLTEWDEYIYHEMISHVPLYCHPNPKNVLVIGGGDGGTIREILKHQEVESVDLVEIDKLVVQVSLKYFSHISSKLLSEKVHCCFENGVEYVRLTSKKYDIIIIDSTDPISVGEGLFTGEFYKNCHRLLKENGILVNQAESPAFTAKLVKSIYKKLRSNFDLVKFYQANIPTYPSGHWLFGLASKKYDPVINFDERRYDNDQLSLRYYNKQIHKAAFVLPNFVREIIEND